MKLLYICIVFLFAMLICFRVVLDQYKTSPKPKTILQQHIFDLQQKAPTLQARQQNLKSVTLQHPPELETLETLAKQFKTNPQNNWDKLLAIADIYHKGAFPRFVPNNHIASRLYETLATKCPILEVANLARVKHAEMSIETMEETGTELPPHYGEEVLDVATNYKEPTTKSLWSLHKPPPPKPQTTFKSDSQNVHDHSVLSIIKNNISAYKNTPGFIKVSDCRDEVRYAILMSSATHDEKYNAAKVLDSITKQKNPRFGESELDVLNVVWARIAATPSEEKRSSLKDMLTKQLASSIENGFVVCSSGKISRIMGTFDGIDDQPPTRPTWALNEEISRIAAQVRDKHLGRLTRAQRVAYDNGAAEDVSVNMTNEFRDMVIAEYKEKLGMEQAILNPIIESYMCGF